MKLRKAGSPQRAYSLATLVAGVMLVAVLAGGCTKKVEEKEPEVSVQVTPAEKRDISLEINEEAVVSPLEQAVVAPKITSTIKQFLVQRGSKVKKGQLLAVLENADLSAAAESSQGDYQQAEAAYATTVQASLPQQIQKAELDAASAKSAFAAQEKVYNSRKELFQQGAVPRRDLDSAEVALVAARSQNEQAQRQLADLQRMGKQAALKSAEGQKLSAEGKFKGAKAQLSYSEIRSPIDGVVTDRPLFVGDLAQANQPLLTVMNVSKLIAKGHIPQSEASLLKVGNPAEITVPGVKEPIEGKVTLVSPALDPGSTTIEVWVQSLKANPELRPGITVEVAATAKTVKDALVVPASAVFKDAEGAGDYVLAAGTDNKAHITPVKTGIRTDRLVQIASGISEGAPVISSGGFGIPEGTKFKVEKAEAGEKAGGADKDDAVAGDKNDEKKSSAGKPEAKEKE